jgi:hypothetical protein
MLAQQSCADVRSTRADKQRRTAVNRTTVRLFTDYSLLRLVNAVATAWDVVAVRLLVQRRDMPVAVMATAFGVSQWHQITDLDSFSRFFL